MARRLIILLTGLGLFAFAGSLSAYGMDGDLDARARASIGNITDTGGDEAPVELGEPVVGERKSVTKAMLLSAALPGLGQVYVGGKRGYATGGMWAAADLFSMWRYFANTGKGDDKKDEYQAWADEHYSVARFNSYVLGPIVEHSGVEDFNFSGICDEDSASYDEAACWKKIDEAFPLAGEGTGGYYEQIGQEDRYIFGWDDWDSSINELLWRAWDPRTNLPSTIPTASDSRDHYRDLRGEADDYYGRADVYAWWMVIGRVASAIDAAILARLRNRDIAGIGTNPRLTFKAKLGHNPNVRIGLKMRF